MAEDTWIQYFLYVNKTWRKILGYSEEEVANLTLWDIIYPDSIPHCREAFQKVMSGETLDNIEAVFVTKDRKLITTEGSASCRFEEGKPVATRGIFRDITERKMAEHKLKERVKELNCLYGIAKIAQRPRITLDELYQEVINLLPKSWQYPEITCARIIINGKEFKTKNHRETEWKQSSDIMVHGAKAGDVEVSYLEERPELDEGPFSKEERQLIDAVAERLGRITERKRVEQALQEKNEQLDVQNEELRVQGEELMARHQELVETTEEAARANRLKSEFLANMSHELRTPLNVIIGFSQLLTDEVPGEINDEQRQCLDDVLESGQHLLNLINEVLDLARIESGRTALKPETVVLADIIKSLTRSMLPILRPRKQSLDVEIEEGLPPICADRGKLGQVLRNLVTNSSKFTPDGGKLEIKATSEDGWCRVSVIDNGIGIKKEDKERIFEPFCQLDYAPTNGKSGTGLGLSVVKQIVEKHGGQVWVESEYGQGSQFTFTLPQAKKDIPLKEENRQ